MIDFDDHEAWMREQAYRDSTISSGMRRVRRLVALVEQGDEPPTRLRWAGYRIEAYADERGVPLDPALAEAIEDMRERSQRKPGARGGRRRKKRQRKAESLPDPHWRALWAQVVADDHPAARVIELMMSTGLRVGDVLRITRRAVSRGAETGVVRIEVKGGDEITRYWEGAPNAWGSLLQAWAGQPGSTVALLVAPGGDGSPLAGHAAYRAVERRLKRLGTQAGIDDRLHTHRLRRTVAVQALRLTEDRGAVGQLLGHAPGSSATDAYIDEARPERVAALQRELRDRFREEG